VSRPCLGQNGFSAHQRSLRLSASATSFASRIVYPPDCSQRSRKYVPIYRRHCARWLRVRLSVPAIRCWVLPSPRPYVRDLGELLPGR
jgi:hypothetical protein